MEKNTQIKTNRNYGSMKEKRDRELKEQEAKILAACNALANERYTDKQMKQWSMEHKGIWFLPIVNDDDTIDKLTIMKPIDRVILSYATTKLNDEGLYSFLEQCMRECWIAGDDCIVDDDDYFLPAAGKFNKIIEGKKAAMLKR